MYNDVNKLQDFVTTLGNSFTPKQLTEIGIQLIKIFNNFEKGLTQWFDLPTPNKTWQRFQTHFDQARASLCQVRGVTMRNTAYHQQANAIPGNSLRIFD